MTVCQPHTVRFIALLLIAFIGPAQAASIRVADGDSFSIGKQRFRLHGIDAPELHQHCRDQSGKEWPCGERARTELRRLLGHGPVQCTPRTTDRFGRSVAVCAAGGRDIGEAMVRAGWAAAYPDHSSPYAVAETQARLARRGLWAGSFENPRAWRDNHPRDDASDPLVPAAVRHWLQEKSRAAREAIVDWVRGLWAGEARDKPAR
ncbi:MAG: thermonuclease family protein [Pseudorhodoplanes sp.]|nr:thermonuclease family protein [Pseudorhodoplanes sp.]